MDSSSPPPYHHNAELQFDAQLPKLPRIPTEMRLAPAPIGSDTFYRDVARELPRCPYTGAKRWARGVHTVVERWRLEADRAGDRAGLEAGKTIILKVTRDQKQAEARAGRPPKRVWQDHDMPSTNGLWRMLGMEKDYSSRLYVDVVCSGPLCSGPTTPARQRKFSAADWMRRQTSCAACATYRRRQERFGSGEPTAEQKYQSEWARKRRERLNAERKCVVCAEPSPEAIKCAACRLSANEASRRLRKEDTKRTVAL
jgi:hypothetical protein